MAKVIINVDDEYLARAIVVWFEQGQAIESFEETNAFVGAKDAGAKDITDAWCCVVYDHDGLEHEVNIETE